MTKAEIISQVSESAKISKTAAQLALNSCIDCIKDALKGGQKVTLVGFGTFSVAERKARKGRNPQTGKAIKIKARKMPKFVPGSALKEAVQK